MRNHVIWFVGLCFVVLLVFGLAGCNSKENEPAEVVVYTSLDKVFSQPVLEAFEQKRVIKVLKKFLFQINITSSISRKTSLLDCFAFN